jgi:sulfoxide reductase heme-binding subunit YedZ
VGFAAALRRATLQARGFKAAVFVIAALPLADLVWRAATVQLGADPEHALIWATGRWALRLLLLTLAITPLRQLTGLAELARLRRMLGLWAFAYAVLHFFCYLWLVNDFSATSVVHDAARHPFVLAGLSALLMLVPLALTSRDAAIRRLGARRWRALHRLVYLIAPVAVFHAWWGQLAKHHTGEPRVYAAILASLLGWRVWRRLRAAPARHAG